MDWLEDIICVIFIGGIIALIYFLGAIFYTPI
jgi:hypothetical protein